ncbi:lipid kinase [Salmonella enterica subsp. enterica serovar Give str. S5-487]|nr:lipid kinase [Salmonella enterica subsp. enterica serovar Give str. S5-487]
MATGGFGTRITTETPEKLKAALGGVSYLIHGLMRMDTLTPDRCEIRGENFHWQGDALVIGIGNGRQAGGGQQLCPTALINDGLLQLRIFTGEELLPALFSTLTQSDDNPNIIDGASDDNPNIIDGMRRMKSRLIWMANHSADKNFILRCYLAHYAVGCRQTARCYVNNTCRWPDALTSGFSSLNSGDGDFAIQIDILYGVNQLHAISHRFLKGFTSQN